MKMSNLWLTIAMASTFIAIIATGQIGWYACEESIKR